MTQTKELRISNGYSAKKEVKEFNFYELMGLKKAFYAIELSNPKRSGKVDYWLTKNDKIVGDAFNSYLDEEHQLILDYAETFSHDELVDKNKENVTFIVYKGKDNEDTLVNDRGAYFKVSYENDKPVLTYVPSPTWDFELPAEEGKEPSVQKMKYQIKFKDEASQKEFDEKLGKLQSDFKTPCDLWTLKEEHLEGLNMMWKGREEDLTQFRNLIYDNAITV